MMAMDHAPARSCGFFFFARLGWYSSLARLRFVIELAETAAADPGRVTTVTTA